MMKLVRLILIAASVLATALCEAETRTWTSSDGKEIEATILDFQNKIVTLETDRGKFELPLERLSDVDQKFAQEWAEKKSEKMKTSDQKGAGKDLAPELGDFENLTPGVWPKFIVADLEIDQITEVEPDSLKGDDDDEKEISPAMEQGQYIYRTPHFEFHAPDRLSASVVREFARIFEASYAFVDQMPLGLAPSASSNGFYKTKLYMTKEEYYSDGGMKGSGGMFSWRRRGQEMSGIIKVPISNLGVEYTGTRFIVDHKKRSSTLTHEIVHQIMIRWLAARMPTWLSEGLAEFVSSQEYDNGRFKLTSMDRAVSDSATRGRGREFRMVPLEKLMNISSREWAKELASGGGGVNYRSANVLTYYFLRLDGDGDGSHLIEYLKVLSSGDSEAAAQAKEEHLLRGRSYEDLEKDVAKAWRGEGLQIEFLFVP